MGPTKKELFVFLSWRKRLLRGVCFAGNISVETYFLVIIRCFIKYAKLNVPCMAYDGLTLHVKIVHRTCPGGLPRRTHVLLVELLPFTSLGPRVGGPYSHASSNSSNRARFEFWFLSGCFKKFMHACTCSKKQGVRFWNIQNNSSSKAKRSRNRDSLRVLVSFVRAWSNSSTVLHGVVLPCRTCVYRHGLMQVLRALHAPAWHEQVVLNLSLLHLSLNWCITRENGIIQI